MIKKVERKLTYVKIDKYKRTVIKFGDKAINPIVGYCKVRERKIDSLSCWECGRENRKPKNCKSENFYAYVYRNLKKPL